MKSRCQLIVRNPLVCIRGKCSSCEGWRAHCPSDCKFGILHLLEKDGDVQCCERRTGKTTRLMAIARELSTAGHTVYYVMPTMSMAKFTEEIFRNLTRGSCGKVRFIGEPTCRWGTLQDGYIVADELNPTQLVELREKSPACVIVAAYYSE